MARFVFQHVRAVRNVGDRVACPARWFDWGPDVAVQGLGQDAPPCNMAILGGGQVYRQVLDALIYHTGAARRRVAWGIGLQSVRREGVHHDIFTESLDLIGTRDVDIPGTVFVPCVSCMAARFDRPPAPTTDVVLYLHGHKSAGVQIPDGIPTRTNLEGTFADAVAFLASGATVVTNSYHGTYWAMLLGRRVLCLPFSAKFHGFARMPALADPADWLGEVGRAHDMPGYRDECRALNRAFHARVLALLD